MKILIADDHRLIVEAVAGNMNMVRGNPEFLRTMRELCTKHGAVLIVDEVMTGFRVAPGFSERVIFRELFPRGLTLLDLKDIGTEQLSMSNIAARQELRELIGELNLPGVSISF